MPAYTTGEIIAVPRGEDAPVGHYAIMGHGCCICKRFLREDEGMLIDCTEDARMATDVLAPRIRLYRPICIPCTLNR